MTRNRIQIIIMKIKYPLALIALPILALTACDDEYLDQSEFDGIGHQFTDVKNLSYTLTDADYATIASNATNKSLALAKSPEDSLYYNALQQLKTLKYFTEDCPADEYIPAFLEAKFPNANASSKFTVTYNTAQTPAPYMADLKTIGSYTLTPADYQSVWGKDMKVYYLSPSTAESKLPSILKAAQKSAQAGDVVAVSYAYSDTEPSIGGGTGGGGAADETYTSVATIVASEAGEFQAKGTVAATYARGFLLNDGTGNILSYDASGYDVKIGDQVTVKGTTSSYGGLMQFASPEVNVLSSGSFTQPQPQPLTAAAITAYVDAPYCRYVSIQGKLVLSGNYVNIEIEGTDVKGSVAYAPSGFIDSALDGQQVTVVGYTIGVTGSSVKYLNIMATSVRAAGSEPEEPIDDPAGDTTTVGGIAAAEAGEYQTQGTVAALYKRGFMLTDQTGNILVYKAAGYDVKVGDQVSVKGKTKAYAGLMQFDAPEVEVTATGGSFTYPQPKALSADDITAYVSAPYCAYVSFVGKLVLSGNYVNIEITGTDVQGSVAYAPDGLVDASLDGQQVIVVGYAIGQTSQGKYLSVMATLVTAGADAPRRAPSITEVRPTHSILYRYDGAAWSLYTPAQAQVAVFTPADYDKLGSQTVTGEVEHIVSCFLHERFPYAVAEQKAVAVYNSTNGLVAADYYYSDAWKAVLPYRAETALFSQTDEGISAKVSTYFDNSLLGDEAGFFDVSIDLGASTRTNVWGNTAAYGWRTYGAKGAPMEGWLISPEFNFTKATAPYLQFEHTYKYLATGDAAEFNQALGVFVITDYADDIRTANRQQLMLGGEQLPTNSDWTFVSTGAIDLSAFVGQKVRIAFRYTCTDTVYATWEVKNLKIAEAEE